MILKSYFEKFNAARDNNNNNAIELITAVNGL